ncbi:Cytochrome o ubiquinol oxidase subunit III [Candidatus Hepatincolaceae symbiont of Richtersius coronifer]
MSNMLHNHSTPPDHHDHHHEEHEKKVRDVSLYGFWLYIMTDLVLFATLFIIYLVLSKGYPAPHFDLTFVMYETFVLLTSSFTLGLAVIYMQRKNNYQVLLWLGATFILGAIFIGLEITEFLNLIREGHTWNTHAYFSSFFTLVGTHGLHVSFGLLWMLALIIQIAMRGVTPQNITKIMVLSLFWHFLDIVWIFVFSIIYLTGAL